MTDVKPEPCPNPWGCSHTQEPVCTHYNFTGSSSFRHQVVCHSCGLRGPVRSTKAEAIAAWNQRHQPQEREAVLPPFAEAWAPDWQPLPDLSGVLSQIGNKTEGMPFLTRTAAQPEREAVLEARDRQLTVLLREMVSAVAESGIEPLPFLRETCEKALAALTTPAPAVSTDEIVAVLEGIKARGLPDRYKSDVELNDRLTAILSRLRGEG